MPLSSTATSVEKGVYWTQAFTGLGALWGVMDAVGSHSPVEDGPKAFLRQSYLNAMKRGAPAFVLSTAYFVPYVGMEKARGGLKSSMNAVVASVALGSAYTLMFSDMKMGAFIAITAGSWGWYKEFEDKIYGRP